MNDGKNGLCNVPYKSRDRRGIRTKPIGIEMDSLDLMDFREGMVNLLAVLNRPELQCRTGATRSIADYCEE